MPTFKRPRLRVLVIEADGFERALLVQGLWQLGHDAVAAGDGFTAMQLARRRSFHLLMLNVTPCNSAPLVMELRKVEPDFKLVLMSGYQLPFCYPGGFVFLPRPFSLQQIRAAVRDAMDA